MESVNCYWRAQLPFREQWMYSRVMGGFDLGNDSMEYSGCSYEVAQRVYYAVYKDHVELFHLSNSIEVAYDSSDTHGKLSLHSLYSPAQFVERRSRLLALRRQWQAQWRGMNALQIEKWICDYILSHCKYEINNTFNQNASTVLLEGKGQCSGISKAVKMMCDWAGIACIFVEGDAPKPDGTSVPHAWNVIYIDGVSYHLDVTYMLGANGDRCAPFQYGYFNLTDDQIKVDHRWTSTLPICNTPFDKNRANSVGIASDCITSPVATSDVQQVDSLLAFCNSLRLAVREHRDCIAVRCLVNGRQPDIALLMAEVQKVVDYKAGKLQVTMSIAGEIITLQCIYLD